MVLSAALLASCADALDDDTADDWQDEGSAEALAAVNGAHMQLVHDYRTRFLQPDESAEAAAPAGATVLEWFGGPVIGNVNVVTIHWGSSVRFGDWLDAFYGSVVQSPYVDWLLEYNTTNQTIGRGKFVKRVVDTTAPTGTTITDEDIQAELKKLLAAGKVPANTPDMLYMFHFAQGVTIKLGDYQSCSYFCAYHNTVDLGNNQFIYYGVIPDMGGGCALGCGFGTTQNNTTSVASHELIEAVTDPAVGAAADYAYPLGWYDKAGDQGEIGDICNGQQGSINGYTVQKEYSNEKKACILQKDGTTPAPDFKLTVTPASQTTTAGGSVTFTVATQVATGTPGTIALSVSGLPAGATGTFGKSSVTPGESTTLTVATTAATAAGTTTFAVSGSAGAVAHHQDATLVVTAGGGAGELMVNGGFELGKRTGWQNDGSKVWATDRRAHAGTWSAKIGSSLGTAGDNALFQGVAVPKTGTTTLTFWYYPICHGTIATDHQQAFITDANGKKLETLVDVCKQKVGWTKVTADMTKYAGQTVMVYFNNHDDGNPDATTYFYIDDVSAVNK